MSTQLAGTIPRSPQSVIEKQRELLERVRKKQAEIAVLGMGHVGLPTALGLAAMGWRVLGADSSRPLISQLQSAHAPFYEPGLDELLKQHLGKCFFPVEDSESAIRKATILFLCVGTPQKSRERTTLVKLQACGWWMHCLRTALRSAYTIPKQCRFSEMCCTPRKAGSHIANRLMKRRSAPTRC